MKFHSQSGEDAFLLSHFFRGRRAGVFVDVGAYDGEQFSNSLFFERDMGWRGLCVEPLAAAFSALERRRACICEQVCVADFEGEATFLEASGDESMSSGLEAQIDARTLQRLRHSPGRLAARRVPVLRLSSLLERHALGPIDYCSIDASGSELAILSELDLERFEVRVLSVDNPYDDPRIPRLMAERGYELVARLQHDQIFKRRGVRALARTSVICSVWHEDPDRAALVAGHAANLAKQTVPVEPIYVFDGRDRPPPSVPGRVLIAHDDLSIYQAWNVALALVQTPLVMNLNLDDRLAPDAVERLEACILQNEAMLVGGDWRICYSQQATDAVEACFPVERIPFVAAWPPPSGVAARLGSGTGERGTFGPATLWRMDAHVGAPRYPWRLPEGTLLRSAADTGWWTVLQQLGKRLIRLRQVIGNYHSHPHGQAEFRGPSNELELMRALGISLL